ncbi:MAG: hypothetical protein JW959_03120 [Pirellulales bacterium]|nr:hypothetical protein [Pirellulales bacterium]
MQRNRWIFAASVLAGVFALAADLDAGCGCGSCDGTTSYWALGRGACCSPPGYCMTPGCCELYRPCCDNAWAGYCENKAKVQAFWAKVGEPRPPRCRWLFYRCAPWLTPCCDDPMPKAEPDPRPDTDVPPNPPGLDRSEKGIQSGSLGKIPKLF